MAASDAKEIRAALKAAGYGVKRVSVRNSNYSMGSSVDVGIKDPDVDFEEVRRIAEAFQRVRYCEASGEILSGGNFFVHVSWSREAEEAKAEPFIPAVKEAFAKLATLPKDVHADVPGTKLTISGDGSGCSNVQIWSEHRMERMGWCNGEDFKPLAFAVARLAS